MKTTEERLRTSLHDYADSVQPDPAAWGEIEDRVSSARHKRIGFGVAAILVVVLAGWAIVVQAGSGDEAGIRLATSEFLPAYVPPEIVAVTEDGRVVVLDTATGDEFRQLAEGADEATKLSVTLDAEMVYFDRPNSAGTGREGFAVPTDGGDLTRAGGALPVVSADGRRLASFRDYSAWSDDDRDGRQGRGIVNVEEIPSPSGESVPLVRGSAIVGDEVASVDLLSWQPNTNELAIVVTELSGQSRLHVLDLEGRYNVPLDESSVVDVPDGVTVLGYFDVADMMLGWSCVDGAAEVVTFSTERGDVHPRPALAPLVTCDGAPSGVDSYNQSYLVVEGGVLHRWTEGDLEPTQIVDGLSTAAWVPPSPPEVGMVELDPTTFEGCVAERSSRPFNGAFDHGTRTFLSLTVEEYCEMRLAVESPFTYEELEAAGLTWGPRLRHGEFEVVYVDYIVDRSTASSSTGSTEIPFEEVVRRVEAVRDEG